MSLDRSAFVHWSVFWVVLEEKEQGPKIVMRMLIFGCFCPPDFFTSFSTVTTRFWGTEASPYVRLMS